MYGPSWKGEESKQCGCFGSRQNSLSQLLFALWDQMSVWSWYIAELNNNKINERITILNVKWTWLTVQTTKVPRYATKGIFLWLSLAHAKSCITEAVEKKCLGKSWWYVNLCDRTIARGRGIYKPKICCEGYLLLIKLRNSPTKNKDLESAPLSQSRGLNQSEACWAWICFRCFGLRTCSKSIKYPVPRPRIRYDTDPTSVGSSQIAKERREGFRVSHYLLYLPPFSRGWITNFLLE